MGGLLVVLRRALTAYQAAAAPDLATFERDRVTDFSIRASSLVTDAKPQERAAYLDFLEELILRPVSLHNGAASVFCDSGFIYRDEHGVCQFLSRPAKDALTQLWAHSVASEPVITTGKVLFCPCLFSSVGDFLQTKSKRFR